MNTPSTSDEHGSADENSVWEASTGVSGLVRHRRSQRYYSRFQLNGKRTMRALKTDLLSVAKLRHFDIIAENERQRHAGLRALAGDGTMAYMIAEALKTHGANTELKARSKTGFRGSLDRLDQHWPACFGAELGKVKPEKITPEVAEQLANYLHSKAQWRHHNGGKMFRGYGAVTVNMTIEALHRVLRFAKARGYIFAVPFELSGELGEGGVRKSEPKKTIHFPSSERILAVFNQMRTVSENLPANQTDLRAYLVTRANESADLAEFMAYSGARVQEAVTWTWEDERTQTLFIRGTKTETSRDREVPKIPAMIDLLKRMKASRAEQGRELKGRAFTVEQCREALASACKRAGVDRWTHHTLRHLFATTCIESNIDIPTVSRWLGHADGGTLAMQTYGHLRREHSLAQAAKVSFGGLAA